MRPEPQAPDLFPYPDRLTVDLIGDEPHHKQADPILTFESDPFIVENILGSDIQDYHRKRGRAVLQSLSLYKPEIDALYISSSSTPKPKDTILSLSTEHLSKNLPSYLLPQGNTLKNLGTLGLYPYPKNPLFNFESDTITAADLPEIVLPILDFIEMEQPHIVIACDRGARLLGLAVHATWRATRPEMPFPTLDGRLHFARISKSEDFALTQAKVDAIVAQSKTFGEHKGNTVAPDEQLRVLFLDDWIISGRTRRIAIDLMEKHSAQTFFGVMDKNGVADVGGNAKHTRVNWHDKSEEIGVNYRTAMYEGNDGTYQQTQTPVVVKRQEATSNRRAILKSARQIAERHKQAQVR